MVYSNPSGETETVSMVWQPSRDDLRNVGSAVRRFYTVGQNMIRAATPSWSRAERDHLLDDCKNQYNGSAGDRTYSATRQGLELHLINGLSQAGMMGLQLGPEGKLPPL
jgi:hypothetical protein